MANYTTPGVYVEEISVFPPSVAQVETAIPAFIGYTEKVPLPAVRRINSLKEFEQLYGKAKDEAVDLTVAEDAVTKVRSVSLSAISVKYVLYYQMQMYFANGGGPCYILSAGTGFAGNPDKTKLKEAIASLEGFDEPTLIVVADAKDEADRYELLKDALLLAGKMQDRFGILDVPEVGVNTFADFRTKMGTTHLSYGAAYYPPLRTSLLPQTSDASVTVKYTGNAALNNKKMAEVKTTDESIYRELKSKLDEALEAQALTLYPSGAVAGIYASVDASRGVWKAPANVSLNLVKGATVNITDSIQGGMNIDPTTGKSINALRTFYGKGTLVWGARTLAGNDNEWRYVSVRRFYNMVEESVKKASAAFVFEPNSANTWVKVRAMIENFLTLQWRAGALAGAKAEDAFFVRVGLGQTMSAQDILEGRMIVEIGMAAVRPAEFIILRFSHMMQQS